MKTRIIRILVVVGCILLIPLYGEFFIDGWNWGVGGFIGVGSVLFVTGLIIDFAARTIASPIYRTLAIGGIVFTLLAAWIQVVTEGAVSEFIASLFS